MIPHRSYEITYSFLWSVWMTIHVKHSVHPLVFPHSHLQEEMFPSNVSLHWCVHMNSSHEMAECENVVRAAKDRCCGGSSVNRLISRLPRHKGASRGDRFPLSVPRSKRRFETATDIVLWWSVQWLVCARRRLWRIALLPRAIPMNRSLWETFTYLWISDCFNEKVTTLK